MNLEKLVASRNTEAAYTKRIACCLISLGFLSVTPPVHAAEVTLECLSDLSVCHIHFRGEIVKGDAAKVLALVTNPPRVNSDISDLVLNSPGGDVAEALQLTEVVRTALITTTNLAIIKNGDFQLEGGSVQRTCVSACVLVWLAGPERQLDWGPRTLGLHRPYFSKELYASESPSQLSRKQAEAMSRVREFLVGEGMPSTLIDAMMNRSSKEIHWVSFNEYKAIGMRPAWFQEVLIATCNFNPDLERALWEGRLQSSELEKIRELVKQKAEMGTCHFRLRQDAQLRMRRPIAPTTAPRPVVR